MTTFVLGKEGIFRNVFTENDFSSIISIIRKLKFPLE